MDFLIDDNMLKTLKPFGLAALGLAALASKYHNNQLLLFLSIETQSKINQSKSNKC